MSYLLSIEIRFYYCNTKNTGEGAIANIHVSDFYKGEYFLKLWQYIMETHKDGLTAYAN